MPVGQVGGTVIWVPIVGWMIIVAGWFIVSWQNNRREERKEVRGYLDESVEFIESLTSVAIDYHSGALSSQLAGQAPLKDEYEILYSLARLEEKMQHLKFLPSVNDAAYNNLKSAITGANFQSSSFAPLALDDPLIEMIRDESLALIQCLEQQFLSAFRSSLLDRIKFQVRAFKETESNLKFPGWFIVDLLRLLMAAGAFLILGGLVFLGSYMSGL